jgi:hypothetical protein
VPGAPNVRFFLSSGRERMFGSRPIAVFALTAWKVGYGPESSQCAGTKAAAFIQSSTLPVVRAELLKDFRAIRRFDAICSWTRWFARWVLA